MFYLFYLSFSRIIDPSTITDEGFEKQFILKDTDINYSLPNENIGVLDAWKNGYSGSGTTILVLTTGAKFTHNDLKNTFRH